MADRLSATKFSFIISSGHSPPIRDIRIRGASGIRNPMWAEVWVSFLAAARDEEVETKTDRGSLLLGKPIQAPCKVSEH